MDKMSNQGNESPKDYIIMNKSLISQWNHFREAKKYHFQDEIAAKTYLAKQRKEEMEEEKRKKNLFQLFKWDFVRQKVIFVEIIYLAQKREIE